MCALRPATACEARDTILLSRRSIRTLGATTYKSTYRYPGSIECIVVEFSRLLTQSHWEANPGESEHNASGRAGITRRPPSRVLQVCHGGADEEAADASASAAACDVEPPLRAPAPSRVPASAGARHFRARRHLPLLVLRHWGKQTELDARCANPPPPLPLARALATPPAPRTDPAPSGRLAYCPRAACTLASSPPPLLPLCAGARHCLLSPDAASPPMPPRPRCRRCPLAPMPPSPRCRLAADAASPGVLF